MIEGYVGLIGNGKTMLAVQHARTLAKRRGSILAANIGIVPPEGVPFVQLTVGEDGLSVEQLEGLMDDARATGRGVVILVDEIGIIMPARFWQSFPIALMYRISQSRKYSTDLIYTSQDIEDVDAYLRRKTQWVYKVKAIPSPSPEKRERGIRPWCFLRTQWRPATIEKRDKRIGWSLLRYRREWERVYDTDELVRPPERLQAPRGSRSGRQPRSQSISVQGSDHVTSTGSRSERSGEPEGLTWAGPVATASTPMGPDAGVEDRNARSAADRRPEPLPAP